tara:strand:- start:17 stop:1576 length:1560 start_codon:yes stop_codon:yes gene_type:complete
MKSDFLLAVTQLATERRLPRDVVVDAIEAALVSAFKKEVVGSDNISVKILPTTGDIVLTIHKIIVDSVEDTNNEISLEEASTYRKDSKLGETLDMVVETPEAAGRIAAQTAKQVVLQRLREAERNVVYEEYATRINEIISGVVQRVDPEQIIINLGRTEAVMPKAESVESEHYRPGQRIRVVVREVERGVNGARIIVSRANNSLIERLFELEVPEVATGAVVLSSIAREPGYRTKVAVETRQEGVDPVGSCVGLRGVRIQNIVNELNGEKIDVIPWNADPLVYISQALSPSQVTKVEILGDKRALIIVPDSQLSLAIGREGQNARLAAKLTGWRIDIRSDTEIMVAEGEIVEPADALVATQEEQDTEQDATVDTTSVTSPEVELAEPAEQIIVEESDPIISDSESEQEVETLSTKESIAPSEQSDINEEDIEQALKELELEEAALNEIAEEESEEDDSPEESFDFDEFLKDYQAESETGGQGIRFAEDIFPEKGGRFKDGRSGGNRRGGQSGGRRGGGR